jgi:hypothetical protein
VTSPTVVLLVVCSLALFALAGLASVVWLISVDADGEHIALVATPMGAALGSLGTLLASTRSGPTGGS